jgi:hypothetical protein
VGAYMANLVQDVERALLEGGEGEGQGEAEQGLLPPTQLGDRLRYELQVERYVGRAIRSVDLHALVIVQTILSYATAS